MSRDMQTSAREAFEAHLPLIREIIRYVARRYRLDQENAEDLSSHILLKLIENDYGAIRAFQGRSSLRTYLTVVIQRLFLDFRVQKWGKWRPSAETRRLGGVALQLDRLLSRDGHSLASAVEILHASLGGTLTREQLSEIAGRLPQRQRPYYESDSELSLIPTDGAVEERLLQEERTAAARQIAGALGRALQELTAEDRLILKMRYQDSFTIREIAAALHLEARPLYARFEKCHRRLRVSLEGSGISWNDVASILGRADMDLKVGLEDG
jgi:RNA polymerase sigma factor (sigma-70 family)